MEYILIDDDKLKVMLERSDLAAWNIDAASLDYSDPEAKKVFEDILGYAKREFGFDTSGHKVLLQLYPSRDGGCEIFVTRLSPIEKNAKQPADTHRCEERTYSFERLSELISVCRLLRGLDMVNESRAWRDSDGVWYLNFQFPKTEFSCDSERFVVTPLDILAEYGRRESNDGTSLYLSEYAQAVCPHDAVERLGIL